jgi:hypothetical protein
MTKKEFRTVISETVKEHKNCNCINCYYGVYGMFKAPKKRKLHKINYAFNQNEFRQVMSGAF